jgi:phosphate transport system substrate-binding protein
VGFAAGELSGGLLQKGQPLKTSNRIRAIAAIAATLPVVALPATAGATTLFGSGSSAEQPILNPLFNAYHRLNKKIKFSYSADGGNQGVKDVQGGRSEFAIQTTPPLPSNHGTTFIKIFLDGLCIAVNPANQLSNITVAEAKNIFLGLSTNWSQIAGSNLSTTIDPYGRNSTAGSYTFFQQWVLGGKTQSSNVTQEGSDGLVANQVAKDANGIGYVGLAHSGRSNGVKALDVNGVPCEQSTIRNNSYPGWRWIWAVIPTPGAHAREDPNVEKFINWVATSKAAGTIISEAGAVPAFNK